MAHLFVTFYRQLAYDMNANPIGAPQLPALAHDVLEVKATPTVSVIAPEHTTYVSIKATGGGCWFDIGRNPEPQPLRSPIESGERLWFGVQPGDRVAALSAMEYDL